MLASAVCPRKQTFKVARVGLQVVTNSGLIRNNARGLALRQKLNSHCSALYEVGLPRSHSLLAEKWWCHYLQAACRMDTTAHAMMAVTTIRISAKHSSSKFVGTTGIIPIILMQEFIHMIFSFFWCWSISLSVVCLPVIYPWLCLLHVEKERVGELWETLMTEARK